MQVSAMQAEHSLEKKQRYFSKAARPNSERRTWVRGAHPAHASRRETLLLAPRERVGSGDETMAGVSYGRGLPGVLCQLVLPGSRVPRFLCVGDLYGQPECCAAIRGRALSTRRL